MDQYNYKNLSRVIGEKVVLSDEKEANRQLTIVEVTKGSLDGDEWEAFSVIFHADKQIALQQGTYSLAHDEIGDTHLFLSPKSETEYESVITRKKDHAS